MPNNKNNGSVERIVFLDIDGPIINEPMFALDQMASMQRTQLNNQAIAFVKHICKCTGAKVVINSTHSDHVIAGRTIKDDLMKWGLPEEYFHEDWKTTFPKSSSRINGFYLWLERHGNPDWVAFDDERFTTDKRLILVDEMRGIDYPYFRLAMKAFGFRQYPEIGSFSMLIGKRND